MNSHGAIMRWLVKRGAKWGLEGFMTLSGLSWALSKTRHFQEGLRILTYHRVLDEPMDSFAVSSKDFRAHMKFLADNYHVMDLLEATERISRGRSFEKGSVCVTFDDGYVEYQRWAAPLLKDLGVPATFFIITGIAGKGPGYDKDIYMDWEGVGELWNKGFSIGSHTVNHRSLGALGETELQDELAGSYETIRSELGAVRIGLSYPYGTLRDFNSKVASRAKEIGYSYAVTAVNGLNGIHSDPFTLRRTTLTRGDGLKTFKMIMNGALDPWLLVDKYGYGVQRQYETGLGR